MPKRFEAEVERWITKSRRRTEAVLRTAVDNLIDEAQTPKAQGGRLPVDTGFLRNSLSASGSGMPSGPSDRESEPHGSPAGARSAVANMELGETLYLGWTAKYAIYQEAINGFMQASAQNWDKHVRAAVAEAKARL